MDQFINRRWSWRRPTISARCLAFKKEIWQRCPFPEWLATAEDTYMVEQWLKRGYRIHFAPRAKVIWQMRSGLMEFALQYYRYMRGEGRAGIRNLRHWGRIVFYSTLIGALVGTTGARWSIGPLAAVWSLYLTLSCIGLPDAVKQRPMGFVLKTLAWIPPALLIMDGAKCVGTTIGTLQKFIDAESNEKGRLL
jgi:hypothetical protein